MTHVLKHINSDAEQMETYTNPHIPLDSQLIPNITEFLKKSLHWENLQVLNLFYFINWLIFTIY